MKEIAPGVFRFPAAIVNAYFVGRPGEPWVLVDTGMPGYADQIDAAASDLYGTGNRPEAILLTHGHFDHSGSARELADRWDVSVYAHPMERPYLEGKFYPPFDPTVGGPMAFAMRFVPTQYSRVNIGDRFAELPAGGVLPFLPGWEWVATPGHSPGHVSFFRREDATLLAGDAVITVDMDSWIEFPLQNPTIARPPTYLTCDWEQAQQSALKLADLEPTTLATGHGVPLSGADVAGRLRAFAQDFPRPAHGRYANAPARTDENGILSLPPRVPDPLPRQLAGVGVAAVAFAAATRVTRASRKRKCRTNR